MPRSRLVSALVQSRAHTMSESLFEELKHYVKFGPADEGALRQLHPLMQPHFARVADTFYRRILDHTGARTALEGGESTVGRLKVTLQQWMDELFRGPWDEAYYLRRCRIGRVHVRIALPQHYMFGAMNVIRREFAELIVRLVQDPDEKTAAHSALGRILDLELAVMLHTYREDLVAQAAKAERLSTFGQLVGSIGHELRNPLGVIETSLHILRSRPAVSDDPRAGKHVERIGEQVELAGRIISDLLDMIRDRPLTRTPVSLADVWSASVRAVAHGEGVVVDSDGLDRMPAVSGDAGQLRQVFVNLLQNAVHAVGDAGHVHLAAVLDGGQVELVLTDTGPGVPPEVRTRMFEPLITTKAKGIGLGLPLVRRIVDRHGGSIHYVPKPGVPGARFVVRLPVETGASA